MVARTAEACPRITHARRQVGVAMNIAGQAEQLRAHRAFLQAWCPLPPEIVEHCLQGLSNEQSRGAWPDARSSRIRPLHQIASYRPDAPAVPHPSSNTLSAT